MSSLAFLDISECTWLKELLDALGILTSLTWLNLYTCGSLYKIFVHHVQPRDICLEAI